MFIEGCTLLGFLGQGQGIIDMGGKGFFAPELIHGQKEGDDGRDDGKADNGGLPPGAAVFPQEGKLDGDDEGAYPEIGPDETHVEGEQPLHVILKGVEREINRFFKGLDICVLIIGHVFLYHRLRFKVKRPTVQGAGPILAHGKRCSF